MPGLQALTRKVLRTVGLDRKETPRSRNPFENLGPPEVIAIEPTLGCNIRCRMCHVSYMPDTKVQLLDVEVLKSLAFCKSKHVIIGAEFEPTIHPDFNRMMGILNGLEARIELVSNGTRLHRLQAPALYESRLQLMTFSFDGIRKATFEHIRRGADYRQTLDNILRFRAAFPAQPPYFAINSTTMRCNLAEAAETVRFWNDHGMNMVRFLFMVVRDLNPELLQEYLYPVRDQAFAVFDDVARMVIGDKLRLAVRCPWYWRSPLRHIFPRNFIKDAVVSDHPEAHDCPTPRQDAQLGAWPGMSFPCKSPFTFARILPSGHVQLCHRFTVGNLYEEDFESIWYGPRANEVRRRLLGQTDLCRSCNYYKFCLSSRSVDVTREDYYLPAKST